MTTQHPAQDESRRPRIPVAKAPGNAPPSPPDPRWHARWLMQAPHRLSFFLAMTVLMASAVWWALVQLDRSGMPGLRVTRIQHYKSLYERQQKY